MTYPLCQCHSCVSLRAAREGKRPPVSIAARALLVMTLATLAYVAFTLAS